MNRLAVLSPLLRDDDRVAVTGATGWFGATALDLLDELFAGEAADRVHAFASTAREVETRAGRTVAVRPLEELPGTITPSTHILHFAFLTRNRVSELGTPAFVTANLAITATVLAALQRGPRSLLMTSSGAALTGDRHRETDLQNNPYGFLKGLDELALTMAARHTGATAATCRIYSVAGAHMTKPDLYALGSLLGMARRGGPLLVRAGSPVIRSYAGVADIVALLLWAGLTGRDVCFDSGGEPIEIGDLATRIAEIDGQPALEVHRTWDPNAAPDRYVGAAREMSEVAADAGLELQDLQALIAETGGWLAGHAQ